MSSDNDLHDQINAVRRELKLPERTRRATDTVFVLEKELAVYSAQRAVLKYWQKKLDDPEARNEVLFALQFFSLIPLPIWTSKKDRSIAFWNKYAEKAYGYKNAMVLGEDYIQLFVNEPEKAQSIQDLEDITEGREGLQHFNMAEDKDSSGLTVKVLTCCFAVFDPRHNEVSQAEISFELSRLDQHQAELDQVQAKWEKAQRRRAELLEKDREYAISSLLSYQGKYCDRCDEHRARCDDVLSDPLLAPAQRRLQEESRAVWAGRKAAFQAWCLEMKNRLEDCETKEEMQEIRAENDRRKEDNV